MADTPLIFWTSAHAYGINNIGTTAQQVLGTQGQRVAVTFHNPGTVTMYVYPAQLSPAPTLSTLGGSFEILPGSDRTLYGGNTSNITAINGAWSAFAASSTGSLTIIESIA